MKPNTTFCEECRKEVEYTTKELPIVEEIRDKKYHYIGTEARCAECGALVWVGSIFDDNLHAFNKVFRVKNGIVSLNMIREIPDKYNIGKRPLSILLGWGEQTFSRYYDGDVPSRQYSDTLIRIYNDPLFFSELLEKNKKNLPSANTYKKCRSAVNALLSVNTKDVNTESPAG